MKIKNIRVNDGSSAEFIKKVSRALARTELGKVTEVQQGEGEIRITFSGLSKSRIVFQVDEHENGFSAAWKTEDIAFIHKALRGQVENTLKDIMRRLGAEVTG